MNKKIVAMLLTAAMSVTLLAGCGGSGDAAKTDGDKNSNKIVMGTNPTFEPFEYQDESGKMKGFDLDLVKAIGEDQGFEVEVKSLEFDALVGALQSGSIDLIAAGMSITPDRQENAIFSKPYMDASLGIIVANDSDIKTADDLKGKVVAAQIGSTGADACQELKKKGVVKEVKLLDNFNTCIQDLKSGGTDAIINDMPVNQAYMKSHPNDVVLVGEPYVADYYGIACAKDNKELADKINAGLDNLIKNGKYQELCKKYNLEVPEAIVNGTAKVA